MKHWILTRDRAEAIVEGLDRNTMTLKAAKQYYSAYGVEVKGNTKRLFIKELMKLVNEE